VFNHEPAGYACPFCTLVAGGETSISDQRDIVWRSDSASALVSPRWRPQNHGVVLVVPNAHYENLYDLPAEHGHAVHDLVQAVAVAIRSTYGCDGVSTRQHNEPAGYQDVWHYHVHVVPRYDGDQLYGPMYDPHHPSREQRLPYVERLRDHLAGG
jgi:histidine triad (HIT) family protein